MMQAQTNTRAFSWHLPGGPAGPGGPSMMPVGNSSPLMVVVSPRSPRSPLSPWKEVSRQRVSESLWKLSGKPRVRQP